MDFDDKYYLPDRSPQPKTKGCESCLIEKGWWFHLRRCLKCGYIGCCNSSPNQHAKKHWQKSKHRVICSFEPNESWFYDWGTDEQIINPKIIITKPLSRPKNQPVPAPKNLVPNNWQELLNY